MAPACLLKAVETRLLLVEESAVSRGTGALPGASGVTQSVGGTAPRARAAY